MRKSTENKVIMIIVTIINNNNNNNNRILIITLSKKTWRIGCNCLVKLQPNIDHFCHVFSTSIIRKTMPAVDEMMVAFKDCHKLKVSMQENQQNVDVKYGHW